MAGTDDRTQRRLVALYEDVLGTSGVGEHDNFFERGGTSLTSIVLLERLHDELGVELPLEAFYDEPTLAGLRRRLDGHRRSPTAPALAALLATAAAAGPNRPAVVAADGEVSYQELLDVARSVDDESSTAPSALRLETSVDGVRTVVAAIAARRPFVLLSPTATADEERRAVQAFASELRHRASDRRRSGLYAVATSGSTGRPKIVVVAHDALLAIRPVQVERYGLGPDDVVLVTAPLHYGYGLNSGLLTPLVGGATVVLPERPLSPATVAAAVDGRSVTVTLGVSFSYRFMLAARTPMPGLRLAMVGGDPLPAELAEAWEDWSGVPLVDGYGTSETDHISNNDRLVPGSVGTPLAGVEVVVEDDDGRRTRNGTGEVLVRSPGMALCYADEPELSAERWQDGWVRTGDIAHVDDDGNIFLRGRVDDQLNVGGAKVDPREVEAVCSEALGLRECAVVGRPMTGGGTEICAYVVADREVTRSDVRRALEPRLSAHKIPTRVVQLDGLPRGANGKVRRDALPAVGPAGPDDQKGTPT